MTPISSTEEEAWTVSIAGARATIVVRRDIDADDASALRLMLSALSADCTELEFDLGGVTYIAHSAQTVLRDECKARTVAFRGITDRLRRILRTDGVQLLDKVTEEA